MNAVCPDLKYSKTLMSVYSLRFSQLEDDQLVHITEFIESGKAVVGLRTSTHAFNYPTADPHHALNNDFGEKVLGLRI